MARSTFKVLFYMNGNKEKNGFHQGVRRIPFQRSRTAQRFYMGKLHVAERCGDAGTFQRTQNGWAFSGKATGYSLADNRATQGFSRK